MLPLLPRPPATGQQPEQQCCRRGQLRRQPMVALGPLGQPRRGGLLLHALAQPLLQLAQRLVGGSGRGLQEALQYVGAAGASQGVGLYAVLGRRGQRARRILAQQCHWQVRAGRGSGVQ